MARNASASTLARPSTMVWLPALIGVAIICGESTNTMGANHTGMWLNQLCAWLGHPSNSTNGGPLALLNHVLRKTGHFSGYGLLGVFFAKGWYGFLRRRIAASWTSLRLRAGACGVASALVVASADEIHQMFLPTRGASVWDVLLDTSGALTLNLIFFGILAMRRNALLNPSAPFTTLGLSLAGLPRHISKSRNALRTSARRRIRSSYVRRMDPTLSRLSTFSRRAA